MSDFKPRKKWIKNINIKTATTFWNRERKIEEKSALHKQQHPRVAHHHHRQLGPRKQKLHFWLALRLMCYLHLKQWRGATDNKIKQKNLNRTHNGPTKMSLFSVGKNIFARFSLGGFFCSVSCADLWIYSFVFFNPHLLMKKKHTHIHLQLHICKGEEKEGKRTVYRKRNYIIYGCCVQYATPRLD